MFRELLEGAVRPVTEKEYGKNARPSQGGEGNEDLRLATALLRQLRRSLVVCAYERASATKAGLMVTQPLWSLKYIKYIKFLMFQSAHNSPDRRSGDASPQMGSNQSPCSNAQKAPSIQNCCGNGDRIQLSLPAGVGAANKVS